MNKHLHRRSFLKNTAAAGIGLSLLNTPAQLFAAQKR
ncbi:twin-arginine translocation signal domain-containing protein [Chitinophaga sedimenti]|nr:twin-arginine translocation signal domain-containing protein [Chitinophaga sedimenti]MCK7556989.1 twin-arginine translocation signal domain-containing protein [Chitinophaga sedimenti]